MNTPVTPPSLVERKKYDDRQTHHIAGGIWWTGFCVSPECTSHNPFLIIEGTEAVLLNPGSRAEEHCRQVRDKIASLIDPARIQHIVILHHDPDWCASLPLFEKLADRNVKIYAPSAAIKPIGYYGCKNPVIGLDDGDSIILGTGRSLDYYDTPDLRSAGFGFVHDSATGTLFTGNVFGHVAEPWNLYASPGSWRALGPCNINPPWPKKAHLNALNKIERLSPQRICPRCGPVIEDDIEKYIEAARKMDIE